MIIFVSFFGKKNSDFYATPTDFYSYMYNISMIYN